jgi:hypothetical protein
MKKYKADKNTECEQKSSEGKEKTSALDTQWKTPFLRAYNEMLSADDIIEAARRLGVIQRQRKTDVPALVEATVTALTPITGMQTTIFANYLSLTGQTIAPSSFYDRFTDEFAVLMKELACRAMKAVRQVEPKDEKTEFAGLLDHFEDIRIADSTCIMLKRLAEYWAPSTSKTKPAGVKLHAVISIRDTVPYAGEISPQRTHDNRGYPEETLERGTLNLFDLGYIDIERFIDATENGAFFLTRLKTSHNPEIVRIHHGNGSRRKTRGLRLDEALDAGLIKPRNGFIDLDVVLSVKSKKVIVRVVAMEDDHDEELHWYLTNVPRNMLSAEDVAETYRIRWIIELVFKQMKSGIGLSTILAWRPSAVIALVYAKIVSLCLVRLLERSVELRDGPHAVTQLALALALTRAMPLLLSIAYARRGIDLQMLEERLLLVASTIARSRNRRREYRKRLQRQYLGKEP